MTDHRTTPQPVDARAKLEAMCQSGIIRTATGQPVEGPYTALAADLHDEAVELLKLADQVRAFAAEIAHMPGDDAA